MSVEKAIFRPAPEHATPRAVCGFFADVFAALDLRPRNVRVILDFREARPAAPLVIDFEKGEPVFRQTGRNAAFGKFAGRWLAEHDVPLVLPVSSSAFLLVPADARRIKVRRTSICDIMTQMQIVSQSNG